MATTTQTRAYTKRGLVLHDTLSFLALLAISVALFGVTLFLFRSFEEHRADLAVRWAKRGRLALAQNHPAAAVDALHTALTYTSDGPEETDDQLLLAQALAAGGHTEEAQNYYLNLWDTHPGDGFINLQLARLDRAQDKLADANDKYEASIFGSWEEDGAVHRRNVRLEFTDFLIEQHLNADARNQLFTVAGNFPTDVPTLLNVAYKLQTAGYAPDALTFLQKAVALQPHNRDLLIQAGQAAYTLADYALAERLLHRALEEHPAPGDAVSQPQLAAQAAAAKRIQDLTLTPDQPATPRADHIITAARIAQTRLRTCLAAPGTAPRNDPLLDSLTPRWTAANAAKATRASLMNNPAAEDTLTQLIYLTEQNTNQACGEPTGDDALLLELANNAAKGQGSNAK